MMNNVKTKNIGKNERKEGECEGQCGRNFGVPGRVCEGRRGQVSSF